MIKKINEKYGERIGKVMNEEGKKKKERWVE